MIKILNILKIYKIPIKLIPSLLVYYFKKILGVDMNNTYGEWVKVMLDTAILSGGKISQFGSKKYLFKLNSNKLIIRNYPSTDAKVLKQVWAIKEYSAINSVWGKIKTTSPINIIDAGANAGYTTVYLKSKFPDSKIVSIEPSKENFLQLEENVQINQFRNIFLKDSAIWYRKTNLSLYVKMIGENGLFQLWKMRMAK